MEHIVSELGVPARSVTPTAAVGTYSAIVHCSWLQQFLKDKRADPGLNAPGQPILPGESVAYPWKKIFIRVLPKKIGKVLPLPSSKQSNDRTDAPLTFSQLLQYVAQTNHRNLWKEAHKKFCHSSESSKDNTIVSLTEHDLLLSEVILRLYSCNIIRVKTDTSGAQKEYVEIIPNKYVSKSYETHPNILPALFALETDGNFFIVHNSHYEYNLLDCLTFSPALLDSNYGRSMFVMYQLLQTAKALCERGLGLGNLQLQDVCLSENLWLQVLPEITGNIHSLDASLVCEQMWNKGSTPAGSCSSSQKRNSVNPSCLSREEEVRRAAAVTLELQLHLWLRGRITNLEYLLELNRLAGRRAGDPHAHLVVPWLTDFTSRCGKNWRDLTKSKYRLTKGDRQLDATYEALVREGTAATHAAPHHVSHVLSDITYYVYMARRTSKEILCKYVRNKWVPAEYPASIQRMQEWTPDECIPEFYTDPTVFKSLHEDLPDLEVPSWATCVEDFITKHREALESSYASEHLHHWIDLTFGYKTELYAVEVGARDLPAKTIYSLFKNLGLPRQAISSYMERVSKTALEASYRIWIGREREVSSGRRLAGAPSVKAKNVCLSLVDGHTHARRGGAVQLFAAAHPARAHPPPPAPPRIHWTKDKKKTHSNESSDDASEEDTSSSTPQHVSRLAVPAHRPRTRRPSSRARSASHDAPAHSSTRHYRVQKSEIGKGLIHLPNEYNPIGMLTAIEALDHFKTKCFFATSDMIDLSRDLTSPLNMYPIPADDKNDGCKVDANSDENSFTNHMFQASYDQNYLRKIKQDVHLESILKERKNRSFNNRYTTDGQVYKKFVTESRRQNMLVIGCLIVEIFLHSHVRPLRTNFSNFVERYNCCRTVLKHNYNQMPKCVSYVAGLLLSVESPRLSFNSEPKDKTVVELNSIYKKLAVTDKGLPPPTPSQLLQPLLSNHLIPFPHTFNIIYRLLVTLHEYEVTGKELNILYTYQCDGTQCEKYQQVDRTKLYFTQRIAEGKVQACAAHLETFINKLPCYSQFDVIDIFLPHYVELLENKETSILAAWYLFDTVSRALGPIESRMKLLKHVVNLYDDDDILSEKPEKTDREVKIQGEEAVSKRKSVKLYHNIFLLQLIVRFGLQCFLEHFTQHLVEAVGGYKDAGAGPETPGHVCSTSVTCTNKKPRYSDETVESALIATGDILSPDTSYGSENVASPMADRVMLAKEKAPRGDPEVFHFETDKMDVKERRSSRSKSPADSMDSFSSSNAGAQEGLSEITQSPTVDVAMPQGSFMPSHLQFSSDKVTSPTKVVFLTDVTLNIDSTHQVEIHQERNSNKPMSPTIAIPSTLKTSHSHFGDQDENSSSDEVERRNKSEPARTSKNFDRNRKVFPTGNITGSRSFNEDEIFQEPSSNAEPQATSKSCKISDMSAESLIWLAHRLGPVLTCRYVTRNLLKMLTLCYIGKDNLAPNDNSETCDEIEATSIADGAVVGDKNAKKVINCLTSIVALYGEQLILFQYLPHMVELIASCRRRLSAPLEGGLVACLQLLKYLVPLITDVKLMEQLQDVILKGVLHPTVRLLSTTRSTYPSGRVARSALACKFLDALYVVAVRIGPEMTRRHLCVPALQRFFLAFDKAIGKTENWHSTDTEANAETKPSEVEKEESAGAGDSDGASSSYLEICRDGTTAEWCVRDGQVLRGGAGADTPADLDCSPPHLPDPAHLAAISAQEELLMVFNSELAHKAYIPFCKLVGVECMERSLKNEETVRGLCQHYNRLQRDSGRSIHRPIGDKRVQPSFSEEGLSRRSAEGGGGVGEHIASSNSFGSNVALVGNRIDFAADSDEFDSAVHNHVLNAVSCKMDNGIRSNRHLRGDWLIYWEHEIGRPDKENRFNLKQIKLQSFSGHTQSVKCLHSLDNENSFMSGSKDKTVKLWSLRNQGDGSAVSQCHWTYSGHRKGILSLTFLESLRMAVSTDSVVHIWDPFMESVVSQLDSIKVPVSIVKTMPAPSPVVLAATTDCTLKMIDARVCTFTHELKVTQIASTSIRCVCVSPSGRWVCAGLASGHLAMLDPRTGLLLAHWRAHDGEVLQLVAAGETHVVSSGLDQRCTVWSATDGKLLFHLKGTSEPVHCLSVYHGELISGTTNNRIGVHTAVDQDASFSSTKLRSDTFRGVLTAAAVLPLNRLLLLGSDSGNISLLC